ncbi:uncharacterized protein LOC119081383 [Bradysia coprophila]|uniref:uncharacterized protein LOC119081383 n=1 Tax=Bradysia coprophila TaxID=38358 RepID=UPI00187D974D|nr:uncharacterized protein LOC119081383 [Bradysia coprophila]
MEKYWTIFIFVIFRVGCRSALTTFGKASSGTYVNGVGVVYPPTSTEEPLTKVYHVYSEFTANWYRAYHYCAQHNMQLATINSQSEYNRLKRQITETKFSDNFWIGLTKLGNSKFYWFGYKEPATFAPLEFSQCSDCSCAAINIEKENLSIASCERLSYFICESSISD